MPIAKPAELVDLERIVAQGSPHLRVHRRGHVTTAEGETPIYVLRLGSDAADVPAIGFFGGVHGLERIGAQVVLAFLDGALERLRWDDVLQRQLQSLRLVFVPVVNPGGLWHNTRSNLQGVDLMRNAPVSARTRVPFLLGGHRISRLLPWYRGPRNAPMEIESQALCDVVHDELHSAPFSIALDCHSGFGLRDRIWFPYAHTVTPIEHLPEVHVLAQLFDRAYPHHDYIIEPQSRQYLAHGDLWDYLYLRANERPTSVFLPLTLEMGSWRWIKKRPRQLFSRLGMFNPSVPHRRHRVLRQHLALFEFLTHAAVSWKNWQLSPPERLQHQELALQRWYREPCR